MFKRVIRVFKRNTSLFKSFSAFADTAFSMKLYSSAAFRILGPQGLQTRLCKFWFRDKGSPIDPHHSAKISSALSCLPEGHSCQSLWCKTRCTKSAVVIVAAYLGLSTSSLPRFVGVDIRVRTYASAEGYENYFQAFAINSHIISHAERHASKFDWTLKWQLSKQSGRKCEKGRLFIAGALSHSSLSFYFPDFLNPFMRLLRWLKFLDTACKISITYFSS